MTTQQKLEDLPGGYLELPLNREAEEAQWRRFQSGEAPMALRWVGKLTKEQKELLRAEDKKRRPKMAHQKNPKGSADGGLRESPHCRYSRYACRP